MPRPRWSPRTAKGPSSNSSWPPTRMGQKRTEPRRTPFCSTATKDKAATGRDAFAQPVGGFGEAAGSETLCIQRFDGTGIARFFQADLPSGTETSGTERFISFVATEGGRKRQAHQ